jgi:hypothetical protein
MPADEHSYGPLTPFGHYETHWNIWPTEVDQEYASKSEEVASPKATTPSTDTLPPPEGEIAPSPGGESDTNPLDILLPPPETNPKSPTTPELPPSGPMAPAAQPDHPLGVPPAGTPESPPGDSDLPKTTLPPLPNPGELNPAGELLPENLLPKDDAPASPKTDEKKKTKPVEPPKQSRTPKTDPRRSRLSASPPRGTPELAFPENRVHKASANVSPASRPASGDSGWHGKSTGAATQQEDSAGKWQGRRTTTPSVNRQVSHWQDVDRPAATARSAAVEPDDGASATSNPLR